MKSQFERKAKGVFDLGHRGIVQLAQFAFKLRASKW